MTRTKYFVDTNVFVYQHHAGAYPEKPSVARAALTHLRALRLAAISPQVVTEFLNVARRKLTDEVTGAEAHRIAELMVAEHDFISLDALTTSEALRISDRFGIDFLDAQIWAAASIGGCSTILTEDVHGDEIEGIAYLNPFAPGFDVGVSAG